MSCCKCFIFKQMNKKYIYITDILYLFDKNLWHATATEQQRLLFDLYCSMDEFQHRCAQHFHGIDNNRFVWWNTKLSLNAFCVVDCSACTIYVNNIGRFWYLMLINRHAEKHFYIHLILNFFLFVFHITLLFMLSCIFAISKRWFRWRNTHFKWKACQRSFQSLDMKSVMCRINKWNGMWNATKNH